MRPPNANEFLLLTLLAEAPRSGYDLDAVIEERRLRAWTSLGTSGLYFILDALRRRGWAVSKREASPVGPARRVFRITERGRQALREAVRGALTGPGGAEVDFALMNLDRVPLGPGLAAYRDGVSRRLAEARARRRAGRYPLAAELIFDRHISSLEAERRWAERALRRLRKGAPR